VCHLRVKCHSGSFGKVLDIKSGRAERSYIIAIVENAFFKIITALLQLSLLRSEVSRKASRRGMCYVLERKRVPETAPYALYMA